MRRGLVLPVALFIAALALGAATANADCSPECPGMLLNAQGNQLDAYDLSAPVPALARTTVIPSHDHDPDAAPGQDRTGRGNDVNGQICRVVQRNGDVRYLMGEDSDQGQLPNGAAQGWGIFAPTGGAAGPWTLVDKIVAPYRLHDNDHLPDNTGCAVSADGSKLFLVDLGVGAFDVPGVGSLFLYYRDAEGNFSSASPGCVLADDLTTAGYIAVHPDGSVLVPESGRSSGGAVSRFAPPFPAHGDDAACASYRSAHPIDDRENFLRGPEQLPFDPTSFVPISIVQRDDSWLVGNVVPGQVNEYEEDGEFVRPVAAGLPPGVAGLAVDASGNLFIADLGLVPCETILCPQDGAGTLWTVAFDPVTDSALPPTLVSVGLNFPEGMGAYEAL